jgi:hypothetical protein
MIRRPSVLSIWQTGHYYGTDDHNMYWLLLLRCKNGGDAAGSFRKEVYDDDLATCCVCCMP